MHPHDSSQKSKDLKVKAGHMHFNVPIIWRFKPPKTTMTIMILNWSLLPIDSSFLYTNQSFSHFNNKMSLPKKKKKYWVLSEWSTMPLKYSSFKTDNQKCKILNKSNLFDTNRVKLGHAKCQLHNSQCNRLISLATL